MQKVKLQLLGGGGIISKQILDEQSEQMDQQIQSNKLFNSQSLQIQANVKQKQIDPNFFQKLEQNFLIIFKCSRFLKDQDSQVKIMRSIQWFRINELTLRNQLRDHKCIGSSIKLIIDGFRKLLNSLENSLKENVLISYHIAQIAHIYLDFIFTYYVKNGQRYLEQELQQSLNEDVEKVIGILENEKNASIQSQALAHDIEFELFMIQAGLTIIPNNSAEGLQILTTFLGGAMRTAFTLKLDDQLLSSIKDGVKYIIKQSESLNMKRKFEAIYFIDNFKWQLIEELSLNVKIQDIVDQIAQVQTCLNLSTGNLWEIHYAWIKMIGFIVNFQLPVDADEFKGFLIKEFKDEGLFVILKEYNWIIQAYDDDCMVILNRQSVKRLLEQSVEERIKLYFSSNYLQLEQLQQILFHGSNRVMGMDIYKNYSKNNESKFKKQFSIFVKQKKYEGCLQFKKILKKLKPYDLTTTLDNLEFQLDTKQITIQQIQSNMKKWILELIAQMARNNKESIKRTLQLILEQILLFAREIIDISNGLSNLQDIITKQVIQINEFQGILQFVQKDNNKQLNNFSELYNLVFSKEKMLRIVEQFENVSISLFDELCQLKNSSNQIQILFELIYILQRQLILINQVINFKFDFFSYYSKNPDDRETLIQYKDQLFLFQQRIERHISSLTDFNQEGMHDNLQKITIIFQNQMNDFQEINIKKIMEKITIQFIQQKIEQEFTLETLVTWIGEQFQHIEFSTKQIQDIKHIYEQKQSLSLELLHLVFQYYLQINPNLNIYLRYLNEIIDFFQCCFIDLNKKLSIRNNQIQSYIADIDIINVKGDQMLKQQVIKKEQFREFLIQIQQVYASISLYQHEVSCQLTIKQFDIFINEQIQYYSQYHKTSYQQTLCQNTQKLEDFISKLIQSPIINLMKNMYEFILNTMVIETKAIMNFISNKKIYEQIRSDQKRLQNSQFFSTEELLEVNHDIEISTLKQLKKYGALKLVAVQNHSMLDKIYLIVKKLQNIMDPQRIKRSLEEQLQQQVLKLGLYQNIVDEQLCEMNRVKGGDINLSQMIQFIDKLDVMMNELIQKLQAKTQMDKTNQANVKEIEDLQNNQNKFRFLKDFIQNDQIIDEIKFSLIKIHFSDFELVIEQQIQNLNERKINFMQQQKLYQSNEDTFTQQYNETLQLLLQLDIQLYQAIQEQNVLQEGIQNQQRNFEMYQKFVKNLTATFQAIDYLGNKVSITKPGKYTELIENSFQGFTRVMDQHIANQRNIESIAITNILEHIINLMDLVSNQLRKQLYQDPQMQSLFLEIENYHLNDLKLEFVQKLNDFEKSKKSQLIHKLMNPIKQRFQTLVKKNKIVRKIYTNSKKSMGMAFSIKQSLGRLKQGKSRWRVRQCLVFQLISIINTSLNQKVVEQASQTLILLRGLETNQQIQGFMKQEQIIISVNESLNHYWYTVEEKVQKDLQDSLNKLKEIQQKIQSELDEEKRQQLIKYHRSVSKKITDQLSQVNNIGSQLGVVISFVQDIKDDLLRLEEKINRIMKDIQEIGLDIKYLRGNSVQQMFEMQMVKVLRERNRIEMRKVFVDLEGVNMMDQKKERQQQKILNFHPFQPKKDQQDSQPYLNQFIWNNQNKNVLLIHGQAGCGKSTVARKIEEYLWDNYREQKYNWGQHQIDIDLIPLVVLLISLPQIENPLDHLIDKTLKSDKYRFDDKQILDFKEQVEKKKLRVLLILDSYDEMKKQYITQNIIQSNHLAKYIYQDRSGQFLSKIIVTCRSELFSELSDYQSRFWIDKAQYSEIQIVKFNELQIHKYLEKYTKKSIFLQLLHMIEHIVHVGEDTLVQWYNINKDKINLVLSTFNLKDVQINEILATLESIDKSINFTKEQKLTLIKKIEEKWTDTKYILVIKQMKLMRLIETPFMMEILVRSLPLLHTKYYSLEKIHDRFVRTISSQIVEIIQQKVLIQIYKAEQINETDLKQAESISIIINELKQLDIQKYNTNSIQQLFDGKINRNNIEMYEELFKYAINLAQTLWRFIDQFCQKNQNGIELIISQNILLKYAERVFLFKEPYLSESLSQQFPFTAQANQVEKSFRSISENTLLYIQQIIQKNNLQRYDFYEEFIGDFINSNINKWRDSGHVNINFDTVRHDLSQMAKGIAKEMTKQQLIQVSYEQKGQYFKNDDKEVWDIYFDDQSRRGNILQILRSGIPLIRKGSNYSFIHKSIQEFFVAKNIYDDLLEFQKKFDYEIFNVLKQIQKCKQFEKEHESFDICENINKDIINYIKQNMKIVNDDQYNKRFTSFRKMLNLITQNTINQLNLFEAQFTQGILGFLQSKVTSDTKFRQALFLLIELTKISSKHTKAGSNALSLLNFCNIDIINYDLSFIKIKNTQLQSINLFRSNLDNSKFSNVDLSGANLNLTSLQNAHFENIILKQEWTPIEHDTQVNNALYSPDGHSVASCSQDGTIRIYDPINSKELYRVIVNKSPIKCINYSQDGRYLISGGNDCKIRIWSTENWKQINEPFAYHNKPIICMAISNNHKYLASACEDSLIILWDLLQFKMIYQFESSIGQQHKIISLSFSFGDTKFLSGSTAGIVQLWDIKQLSLLRKFYFQRQDQLDEDIISFDDEENNISKDEIIQQEILFEGLVKCSPESESFASSCNDASIVIIDMNTQIQTSKLKIVDQDLSTKITCFQYSNDGRIIISAMSDNIIRIWSIKDQKQLGYSLVGHKDQINSIFVHNSNDHILSASSDRTIRIWDLITEKQIEKSNTAHNKVVYSIEFSKDGRKMASYSKDKKIKIWDAQSFKQIGDALDVYQEQMAIMFSSDCTQLIALSRKFNLIQWDLLTKKITHEKSILMNEEEICLNSCISQDCELFAFVNQENFLIIRETFSQNLIHSINMKLKIINLIKFSSDSKKLTIADTSNNINILDLNHDNQNHDLQNVFYHSAQITDISFSSDNVYIASASLDKTVKLWNINENKQTVEPMIHFLGVRKVIFAPNKKMLLSLQVDGSMRVWNILNGQQLGITLGDNNIITAISFSHDSKKIITGGQYGSIQVWDSLEQINAQFIQINQNSGINITSNIFLKNKFVSLLIV